MPKPFEGEEIDPAALREFALQLCRKVKEAVDKGQMSKDKKSSKKQIKEIFDHVIQEKEKANARPIKTRRK